MAQALAAVGTGFAIVNTNAVPSGATLLCTYGYPKPSDPNNAASSGLTLVTPTVPVHVGQDGHVEFYVNGAWVRPIGD